MLFISKIRRPQVEIPKKEANIETFHDTYEKYNGPGTKKRKHEPRFFNVSVLSLHSTHFFGVYIFWVKGTILLMKYTSGRERPLLLLSSLQFGKKKIYLH